MVYIWKRMRALALPVSLLFIIFLWPFTCASMPLTTHNYNNKNLTSNYLSRSKNENINYKEVFIKNSNTTPINRTEFISNNRLLKQRRTHNVPKSNTLLINSNNNQQNEKIILNNKNNRHSTMVNELNHHSNNNYNNNNFNKSFSIKINNDNNNNNNSFNSFNINNKNNSNLINSTSHDLNNLNVTLVNNDRNYKHHKKIPHRTNFSSNEDIKYSNSSFMIESTTEISDIMTIRRPPILQSQRLRNNEQTIYSNHNNLNLPAHHEGDSKKRRKKESALDRNERSANLSHITGTTRKIQLYIKNRYIQILPDGTVNGTQEELNDYTILQRQTVDIGQIKIQSVATCLFLCMDACGTVYASKEFIDDCIFNESMEQHHYNTYSSTVHSNPRRTLYLALNRHGQPRKIHIPASRPLGKLATYTKSLTQTVPHDRVENLITRLFGPTYIRHGLKQLCEKEKSLIDLTTKKLKTVPKCNLKTGTNKPNVPPVKKKRNKRKCRPDEPESEICFKPPNPLLPQAQQTRRKNPSTIKPIKHIIKCADADECKTRTIQQKKVKTQIQLHQQHQQNQNQQQHQQQTQQQQQQQQQQGHLIANAKKPRPHKQIKTKRIRTTTAEPTTTSTTPIDDDEMYNDEAVQSSSTESHEDDEWETSSIPPYADKYHYTYRQHHISQFIDEDDYEFDAKK